MSLLTGLLRSVYSDATQLEVELSCVVIKGATTVLKLGGSERRRREPSRGAEEVGRGEGVSLPH